MALEYVVMPCRRCGDDRVHEAMQIAYTEHVNRRIHMACKAFVGKCKTCGTSNIFVYEREVKNDG